MKNFGFATEVSRIDKFRNVSKTLVLKISGPLFDGTDRSVTSLRIEISLRKDLFLEPEIKEIIPIYPDVRPYLLQVMKLEEIFAEKVRAIFYRGRASDLYDLWFLNKKNVKIDMSLVNTKLSYYKMSFSEEEFKREILGIEKRWEEELKPTTTFVPSLEIVFKDIESSFFTKK
jgi:predicted nucleotidyltransferase component of viral defense system